MPKQLIRTNLEKNLLKKNSEYRCRVLNLVEEHLGKSENWTTIRSRLLGLFGERGMSGDIQRILNHEFLGSGQ